jgi:Trk K+ transport system NAD-binding subunit
VSDDNTRPRPAEVLVTGDRYTVICDREAHGQLLAGERVG